MLCFLFFPLASLLIALCGAAPTVTQISNNLLDSDGIFFVSFDGVVNVNSFQLSGVLTFGNFQFAGWYTSTRTAILARRQLPSGSWSTLQLPHNLTLTMSLRSVYLRQTEKSMLPWIVIAHKYFTPVLRQAWRQAVQVG